MEIVSRRGTQESNLKISAPKAGFQTQVPNDDFGQCFSPLTKNILPESIPLLLSSSPISKRRGIQENSFMLTASKANVQVPKRLLLKETWCWREQCPGKLCEKSEGMGFTRKRYSTSGKGVASISGAHNTPSPSLLGETMHREKSRGQRNYHYTQQQRTLTGE